MPQDLQSTLTTFATKHRVPGVSVAYVHDDVVETAAAGVANLRTGLPCTTETLFLIGSISKVWTATLVMQLVHDGLLDLDADVGDFVPAFGGITVRQTLNHTSGLDVSFAVGERIGRGDDCIVRFLDAAAKMPRVHEPGALWSYCNTGIVLAGRIVEIVTGLSYDEALRTMLCAPLSLEHTVTLPEEAILYNAAAGHVPGPDGGPVVTPTWTLPRCFGPAGSTICASARDLLTFARMHLDDDRFASMREHSADVPDPALAHGWGIGWALNDLDGLKVVGHGGGNIGQYCRLLVVPERGFAIAVLTNAFRSAALHEDVLNAILPDVIGVTPPPASESAPVPAGRDLRAYEGTFGRVEGTLRVVARDGALEVGTEIEEGPERLYGAEGGTTLTPVGGDVFFAPRTTTYGVEGSRMVFLDVDGDGEIDFLHSDLHAYAKR